MTDVQIINGDAMAAVASLPERKQAAALAMWS